MPARTMSTRDFDLVKVAYARDQSEAEFLHLMDELVGHVAKQWDKES
jgi:hypothetical protein